MMTATLSSARPAARSAPRLPDDRSNPSTYELRTSRAHPSADPTCPLIAARAMRSARPARTSLPFRFRNSFSQRRDLTASARRCLPSQVITLTLFIPFYPLSCDSAKPSGPSLSRPATPATRHSPPATNLDSISPQFYFTAPCNCFSLNPFHNISDKVKFLLNHVSSRFGFTDSSILSSNPESLLEIKNLVGAGQDSKVKNSASSQGLLPFFSQTNFLFPDIHQTFDFLRDFEIFYFGSNPHSAVETQPEIVVRPRFGKRTTLDGHLTCGGLGQPKAEKNSRQPENSQFNLRLFRVYQLLTSISEQELKFLREASHTTIVDWSGAGILPAGSEASSSETRGLQVEDWTMRRWFCESVAKAIRNGRSPTLTYSHFYRIRNGSSKLQERGR